MPPCRFPHLTHDELMALFQEHGTWIAVRESLNMSVAELNGLKRRLGCSGRNPAFARKKPSLLDPYLDAIRECAARGLSCPEIVLELNLPVQAEQLRRQLHRHGIPLLVGVGYRHGDKNIAWKGGRQITPSGYVRLRMPEHPFATNGYVLEHRYVMEQFLGRYLERHEVVHHLNNDKQDNRIENLQLFASNAEHLAETLKGQIPNWTEAGLERMREALRKSASRRRGRASVQPLQPPLAELEEAFEEDLEQDFELALTG